MVSYLWGHFLYVILDFCCSQIYWFFARSCWLYIVYPTILPCNKWRKVQLQIIQNWSCFSFNYRFCFSLSCYMFCLVNVKCNNDNVKLFSSLFISSYLKGTLTCQKVKQINNVNGIENVLKLLTTVYLYCLACDLVFH